MKRWSHVVRWASTILALALVSLASASEGTVDAKTSVTVLTDTLAPLIDQFNTDADKVRVLALLSPT